MTRRFFAAKPLTSVVPGNSLSMGLSLSPVGSQADTTGLIRPDDCPACPECPPGCVEDIVQLGWYESGVYWGLDRATLYWPPGSEP